MYQADLSIQCMVLIRPHLGAVSLRFAFVDNASMDMHRLAEQLAATFPDAPAMPPLIVLGEGFGSVVLETGSGIVFRIAKHTASQGGHRREVRVLPVVRQHVRELAVPQLRYALQASTAFPYGALGYDKLPGRAFSPTDIDGETQPHLARQAADFLVEIHGIDVGVFRDANLPAFPPPPTRLIELWGNASAFLRQHLDRSEFHAVRSWLDDVLDYDQRYPYTPTLVHGDFWHENLLFDEGRRRLVGVIDFENAAIGDVAIDLATLRYLGDGFARAVSESYYQSRVPRDLGERTRILLGVRELLSLELGLATKNVDADAVRKIREVILGSPARRSGDTHRVVLT